MPSEFYASAVYRYRSDVVKFSFYENDNSSHFPFKSPSWMYFLYSNMAKTGWWLTINDRHTNASWKCFCYSLIAISWIFFLWSIIWLIDSVSDVNAVEQWLSPADWHTFLSYIFLKKSKICKSSANHHGTFFVWKGSNLLCSLNRSWNAIFNSFNVNYLSSIWRLTHCRTTVPEFPV